MKKKLRKIRIIFDIEKLKFDLCKCGTYYNKISKNYSAWKNC